MPLQTCCAAPHLVPGWSRCEAFCAAGPRVARNCPRAVASPGRNAPACRLVGSSVCTLRSSLQHNDRVCSTDHDFLRQSQPRGGLGLELRQPLAAAAPPAGRGHAALNVAGCGAFGSLRLIQAHICFKPRSLPGQEAREPHERWPLCTRRRCRRRWSAVRSPRSGHRALQNSACAPAAVTLRLPSPPPPPLPPPQPTAAPRRACSSAAGATPPGSAASSAKRCFVWATSAHHRPARWLSPVGACALPLSLKHRRDAAPAPPSPPPGLLALPSHPVQAQRVCRCRGGTGAALRGLDAAPRRVRPRGGGGGLCSAPPSAAGRLPSHPQECPALCA